MVKRNVAFQITFYDTIKRKYLKENKIEKID